jgi:hypothetical protein
MSGRWQSDPEAAHDALSAAVSLLLFGALSVDAFLPKSERKGPRQRRALVRQSASVSSAAWITRSGLVVCVLRQPAQRL